MKENNQKGKVYLVGAGIGNIDYLTIKGKQLITKAQVIIYDSLINENLLEFAPKNCVKIAVGKRAGEKSTPQSEINQLLITYCLQGYKVIRLKSGDPLIFGRGQEEINALKNAHCNYELIPGISSALAGALFCEIPLTEKKLSQCFTILTGHEINSLNWQNLAKMDTLVILMGTRNLEKIINKLQENNYSMNTPIAIIKNCGFADQQIWTGLLNNILNKTQNIKLSPSVIIIGKVVQFSAFFQEKMSLDLPKLTNKTIIITRAVEQSSNFANLLKEEGANVIEMSALEITPPSSWQSLDQSISKLNSIDWLILTSGNGVNYFFNRLIDLGKDLRALNNIKIAVVGKKTAETLEKFYLKPDFIPPNFIADSLVENFPEDLTNKTILFPRVETGGRAILVEELTSKGAQVIEVSAYESACPSNINLSSWEALINKEVNVITFASSKTVKNFNILIEKALHDPNLNPQNIAKQDLLKNIIIASIGPQTSHSCKTILGRFDLEAKEYTLEGLTKSLIDFFNHN
jgi:uroporphyrinogen III methyltransferase / synthase